MATYLCRDASPYPTTLATHPKRDYTQILTELLFGQQGEFTNVSELLYTEVLLPKGETPLAEILDCIAQVDLRHFRMLSETLVQCGGMPQFRVRHGVHTDWWSARTLSYPTTVPTALALLCAQKRGAIMAYNNAIKRCEDDGIVRLLRRISADEICHLDVLTALADSIASSSQK